jgi:hypothetical protein
LPESVARAFRVDWDDRAPPAHVERTGGRRLDFVSAPPEQRGASAIAPVLPRG